MEQELISSENKKWLRSIGLFQIIGGAIGLILIFLASLANYSLLIVLLPGFALFGFSIYAGLSTYNLKPYGIKLSIINQILQIVSISIGQFGFQYISGLGLALTLDFTNSFNLGIDLNISSFSYSINKGEEKYFLELNVLAIYLIYKIEKIKKATSGKKELLEQLKNKLSKN